MNTAGPPGQVRPETTNGSPSTARPRAGRGRTPPNRLRRFYVGAPEPSWLRATALSAVDRAGGLALFVSHRRLTRLRTLPRARLPWALDSGGFTELRDFGLWRTSARDYVRAVARYDDLIGGLEWAAPQDWMCEPLIRARTGLSVRDHQHRTVENYLGLRELWPQHSDETFPIMPVLQGWTVEDYVDCVDLYATVGIHLAGGAFASGDDEPVVGVGSVCGRPAAQVRTVVAALDQMGIPLHAFGINIGALRDTAAMLVSADSMSWSAYARAGHGQRLPGCRHAKCTYCLPFALRRWQTTILPILAACTACDADLFSD